MYCNLAVNQKGERYMQENQEDIKRRASIWIMLFIGLYSVQLLISLIMGIAISKLTGQFDLLCCWETCNFIWLILDLSVLGALKLALQLIGISQANRYSLPEFQKIKIISIVDICLNICLIILNLVFLILSGGNDY